MAGALLAFRAGSNAWPRTVTPPVASPTLWLRGDGITGVADGAAIPSWTDYSGNGYTVAQSGAGKPTYSAAGGANGTAAALFTSASSQYLTTTAPQPASETVITVVKFTTLANEAIVGSSAASGLEFRITTGSSEILKENTASIAIDTTVPTTGTTAIRSVTFASGASYAFYINGTQTKSGTTATTLTTASNFVQIGRNGASGSEYLNGLLSEVLIYPRVLTSGELSTVDHYLATRYGLTVTD